MSVRDGNYSTEDLRLLHIFQFAIVKILDYLTSRGVRVPFKIAVGDNFMIFHTILGNSFIITQELLQYLNNLLKLVYTFSLDLPQQSASSFARTWRQLASDNAWSDEFTPYHFVLKIREFISVGRKQIERYRVSPDGRTSSAFCDGFVCFVQNLGKIMVPVITINTSEINPPAAINRLWTDSYSRDSLFEPDQSILNNDIITHFKGSHT